MFVLYMYDPGVVYYNERILVIVEFLYYIMLYYIYSFNIKFSINFQNVHSFTNTYPLFRRLVLMNRNQMFLWVLILVGNPTSTPVLSPVLAATTGTSPLTLNPSTQTNPLTKIAVRVIGTITKPCSSMCVTGMINVTMHDQADLIQKT